MANFSERSVGAFGACRSAGQDRLTLRTQLPLEPGTLRATAEEIASLMKEARSRRFDFLAYLLTMALREARRLGQDNR